MKLQQDGDLEVALGETVTVEIEAAGTAFLAHTGSLQLGQWKSINNVPPKEVRMFTVGPTFSRNFSFSIGFDFSPAVGGNTILPSAQYTVRITGDGPSRFVRERIIQATPILPTVRVFSFEVGQG